MKKTLLAFFAAVLMSGQALSQATIIVEAPLNNNSTSTNRGPNGTTNHTFMRGCFLVLATELTNIPSGTSITSFGYTLSSGTAANAVTGSYTLYLENTTDNSYQKGTTWSTAISGMTTVYASVLTIPLSATTTSVMITLSTPFTYGGSGIYVAYDWASGSPFSTTAAVYLCESTALPLPGGGGCSGASSSAAPTTLGLTNFRPSFLFGFANPFSNDMSVLGMTVPGKVPAMFNTSHNISAVVKNGSSVALTSIGASLTVTGANPFTDVITISSLAAGASTLITFAAYNPLTPGLNSVVVSVPTDQNNGNNSLSYSQSVTCNQWAQNPATGSYTGNPVGFTNGAGIVGVSYLNPVASTITAVRIAISTNTPAIGNSFYGAILSSTGATLAVTTAVNITSGMLGTVIELPFATPYAMSANTSYYIGGAQTANLNLAWFPFATYVSAYIPPNLYAYIPNLTGGGLTALPQNFGYFGLEGVFQPTITLAVTPQTVSCGSSATIQALSSTNYSWNTGPTTSSIVVSPTVNTVYTVVATNTMGCINTKTVGLTITPLPVSVLASADTICLGGSVNLTASGASSFTWNAGTNLNSASNSDSPVLTSLYTVTGTIPAGCINTAQVLVAVRNYSTLSVQAPSHTICLGNSAALIASGAETYTWDSGSGTQNGPNLIASPSVSTTYTVTGADNLGCSMDKTVAVNVIYVPLQLSADTGICFGSPVTLTATGANSYVWTNGFNNSPFQNYLIGTVTVSATYSVTGTGQMNCTTTSVVAVTMHTLPIVAATAQRLTMCTKEKNIITATGATTYSWSSGELTNTIVVNPTVDIPITKKVWGFDANGCKSDNSITIQVSKCTGLTELSGSSFKVYPNPGTGKFVLMAGGLLNSEFTVINSLGQAIQTGILMSEETQIDLEKEPSGIYFLSIEGAGSSRIIKQ